MYGDSEHLLRSKDAGASAFVSKDAPAADVVTAIRQAAARPDDFMADGLAEALAQQSKGQGTTLTKREQEVLGLLADGLGVAGISKRLYISESTTKTHVAKIYAKLGASNRAQALMTAIRKGLVSGQAED
jgi:DNA-binding NarL/FixJ family response regulator